MKITIDEAFVARLNSFCAKHCKRKVARLDMFLDLCAVFGLRLGVERKSDNEKEQGTNA